MVTKVMWSLEEPVARVAGGAVEDAVPIPRILAPGRNCWRVEQAARAAVLVDGADYFARLEEALPQARRSIMIVGWDFDGRIRLCPQRGEESLPLGELLRALVETRPELEIRILVWSVAVLHAPGAPLPLLFGAEWQNHPRIALKLDNRHPLYGAHHQKLVCIDDALAFVGGMDLTVDRWDTCRHDAADPLRRKPDGTPYGPVHDVQMVVQGAAARAVGNLARDRWLRATGETLPPVTADAADGAPWPPSLAPEFRATPVAIARTEPAWGELRLRPVREAAALTFDALRAARRSIYIETQYLTARNVRSLLARRLAELDGPEIIVVVTRATHGLIEHFVMGRNRERLVRRLKRADRYDRLRVFHPVVPAEDGECDVLIHSKVIIVDDDFVRVGSSNLNNRSTGLDTECDLAIEAPDAATRAAIGRLRARLLGEHLDVAPEWVLAAITREGSLIRAIERLNRNRRGLRGFVHTPEGPTSSIPGTRLLDPSGPFRPFRLLGRRALARLRSRYAS